MNAELDDLGRKRDQANQLIESRKRADQLPIPNRAQERSFSHCQS
jgi:sulfur transfer protein SufE